MNNPPKIQTNLKRRFGDTLDLDKCIEDSETLQRMSARGSCRAFQVEKSVDIAILRSLAAVALASPTKSDLQQRDIIILDDPLVRSKLAGLLGQNDWTTSAPAFLVFCGNNRRQRQIHDIQNLEFANDHLDAFFNAAVDAGIALSAFVTAAEAIGLGCCPVSAIRNHSSEISDLLKLPSHVFPVAGLGVGWPYDKPEISLRLPLSTTVHLNTFDDAHLERDISGYDDRRRTQQPYADPSRTWSQAKAHQYSQTQREDFGAFIRSKGFKLD